MALSALAVQQDCSTVISRDAVLNYDTVYSETVDNDPCGNLRAVQQGVHTVINFEMPRSPESYIHRVGRTARAGCGGRSVTLIGECYNIDS